MQDTNHILFLISICMLLPRLVHYGLIFDCMRLPETHLDYRTRKHFNKDYKANLSDTGSTLICFFKFIDCLQMWMLDKFPLINTLLLWDFVSSKNQDSVNCYILDSGRRPHLYSFHVYSLLKVSCFIIRIDTIKMIGRQPRLFARLPRRQIHNLA